VIELAFWEGVRDTQDPALLGAYLDKYPDGQFALIAQPGSRGCKERVGTRDEWRRLADAGREARQTA
jgi:hypothetical protein